MISYLWAGLRIRFCRRVTNPQGKKKPVCLRSITNLYLMVGLQYWRNNNRKNGFELTKKRSRRYPAKTITDADDIALLANTPNQAETLLHSLEWAAAGIGLHVNAHKTEFMCFNQKGDISTLDGTSLKQVNKFTYLGSSVSSTEEDIETRLTKAWTAIDRLSIIWKSNLTDKMKRIFFQAASCRYCCMDALLWRWLNGWRRSLTAIIQECYEEYWIGPGSNTPHGANCTATYHLSRKLYKLDEPDMPETAGEARTRSQVMCSCGPPHMANQKQDDQLEHSYSSSVMIWDVTLKTYRRRWMIGIRGERVSGISVLAALHDDDEKIIILEYS